MAIAGCRGRHGFLCYEDQDPTIGASIRAYGEWAEEEIFLLSSFLQPGAVALDVGAHIGTHTLAFARFVGAAGSVIAIDAQERASRLLALNIALNEARQVKCVRALVSHETGCRFVPPDDETATDLGSVTFYNPPPVLPPAPFLLPLPMIRIDDLALARCDLIKIDIEGMEFDALRGGEQTIRQHRPVIYFEQARPEYFAETFVFLEAAGYRLWWHVADPFNRWNFRAEPTNIFGGTREVNVLALPAEVATQHQDRTKLLPPIESAVYDPPSKYGSIEGWPLPEGAYRHLPRITLAPFASSLVEKAR